MAFVVSVNKMVYLDCQKNHATALGRHCVDGCMEYVPPVGNNLNCEACGCHRDFHRSLVVKVRVPVSVSQPPQPQPMPAAVRPRVDSDDGESSAITSAVTTNAPSASTASSFAHPGAAIDGPASMNRSSSPQSK
ncbi:zinc-finger homeodomain protein 2 [Brachypodium distachyon]|uniref:ZF-HD dimerization-type domain-containing protein n=1 Tax=Brachypodium distachyon TaxID=15368 RepID=I1H956_BRADI|nr:zinc-finger homeodomain protein 2 [Brachypodium distachyon]KQK23373.1 hypothetical protein BRADI_1g73020v3 [Brachypodium distachyon]|eukprot:XP_010230247.1 zinc-finger homeodomain protein 2 [Brachypodium distachyon]